MKKIFIISGEASGDLHGSHLVKEMKLLNPQIQIQGWGGDKMQQQDVMILKHIKDLAFMGFVEVVKHLPEILNNFKLCKQHIQDFNPDCVLFVDYPGFNLRMAKWCKENAFKTIYYISPQIWAWKEKRVFQIKKYVNLMICILPFEKAFYKKFNVEVKYVGHPLVEILQPYIQTKSETRQKVIALLPGSRKQEVNNTLKTMLASVADFSEYSIIVAQSPTLDSSVYEPLISKYPHVQLVQNKTYEILQNAAVALVSSGTATLETALLHVPQIVCFKGSGLSVWLARKLIKIKYISLVNLILNKTAIPELIQKEFNKDQVSHQLNQLLNKNSDAHQLQKTNYIALTAILQQEEKASKLAAAEVLNCI